ncbi:hypothetical protein GGQ91_003837, partial [Methylobacterium fujisawaense]|nr:hypothetical protein [Methylobacterium fujisawaense]
RVRLLTSPHVRLLRSSLILSISSVQSQPVRSKDATVKRYHYDTHEQLRAHLPLFVDAYNHARRLKTLRGLTPYEHVLQVWTKQPKRFKLDPSHHIPGPYNPARAGLPA